MPFRYRLQKALDFRIREKDKQLQVVLQAQQEVYRVEGIIELNKREIASTKANKSHCDYRLLEAYDRYLYSLYDREVELQEELKRVQDILAEEKEKLTIAEKNVKVLEKHKEKMKEIYKEEEKAAELKQLSEVAVQKHFAKTRDAQEEAEFEAKLLKGQGKAIEN